jgi:hypothetical protein
VPHDPDDGIRAPQAVAEGGTIEVEVRDGAKEIVVYVGDERTGTRFVVENGRVRVPVPSRATAGTLIHILTARTPPSGAMVEVVGSQESRP